MMHPSRRLQKKIVAALAAVITGLLCLLAAPYLKAHLQAVAVLDQVSGTPVPHLLADFVAHPVRVEDLNFTTANGPVRARIYVPTDAPNAPAMVVLHGVHHLGIDEPRLRSFAAALASCGIRVLTPQLPNIADYRISPAGIHTIGESVRWFAQYTGGKPVGVMGLSFAGGLALIAASDPAYTPSIRFVFAVGSQDSMQRVTQYYRTGRDLRPDGTIEILPAHEYGPLVIEYSNLEDFVAQQDITPIRAVLRAHLYEDPAAEKSALAALAPPQRKLAQRLMTENDPVTQSQLAVSEARHIADMLALSPASHLKTFSTPVYLLHGEADNVIPAAESMWMVSELPRKTLRLALISPILSHVDMNKNPTLRDQWHLLHLFALVLHDAETKK